MVEDSEHDEELVLLTLNRAGFDVEHRRVENGRAMREALAVDSYDLIISDFSLPAFSGSEALKIAAEVSPDIPLIVVSGNIGEETAVNLMLEGARDYVMKNNLPRLIPAMERELAEARVRQQNRRIRSILEQVTSQLFTLAGKDFFEKLVKVLAEALATDCAYVALFDEAGETGTTLALYQHGQYRENITYDIPGSPCEKIGSDHYYFCDEELVGQFPKAVFIHNMGMSSYAACALLDSHGDIIGSIGVMHGEKIHENEFIEGILSLCATRAAAECERMRNEEVLRQSEARMSSILNNMQDVLFRVHLDGLIEWVTPSIRQLLGYPHGQVIGLPYNRIFATRTGQTTLQGKLDEQDGVIQNLELPLQHRDGHVVWVSINAHYYNDNNSGKHIGIEGVMRNITQRRMAESALRQSEELFATAFHASPAMMAINQLSENIDVGHFIDVNEAFLNAIGYSREEVINNTADTLGLYAKPDPWQKFFDILKTAGTARDIELPFRTRDGEIRHGLGSIESLQIAGRDCALTVCQDITERKKTNEELAKYRGHLEEQISQRTGELSEAVNNLELEIAERKRIEIALVEAMTYVQVASRAKSDFLANMSHELRTPLNSIIGFSELLMLDADDNADADAKEKLGYILDSSWMLLSLINDILDLSKIESGKMNLDCEPVVLQDLLDTTIAMFREKASRQGLELRLKNRVIDQTVYVDRRKVRQVLINLLSNAIKFTTNGGSVTLRASTITRDVFLEYCSLPEQPDDRFSSFIRFDVIDTGIGISAQDMDALFEPFHQIDSALNRKYEGTGLGLHLCQQLVKLQNGCLQVRSEPAQGSTFSVTLPCGLPG